jgi:hypothetical protein
MKKIILLILLLSFSAFGAAPVIQWRGGAAADSMNWNNAANWVQGTVPVAGDSVVFDSLNRGSVKNCTLKVVTPALKSIRLLAAYTGGFILKSGGKLVTTSTDSIANAGKVALYDSVIVTGDGGFYLAANVTWVAGGGSLSLRGTGTFSLLKNISTSSFLNIDCAYAGKTTTYESNIDAAIQTGLLTVNSGTLVLNYYFYKRADNANLFAQTGTITSSSGKGFVIQYGTATAWNLPALTLGGNAYLYIANVSSGTSWTITQTGHITIGSSFSLLSALSNSPIIFHTGTNPYYNITAGTYLSFTGNASCNLTINLNSSTVTCGTTFAATTSNNTINMGSSRISCGGSFTLGATDVVNAGTSLVTFTNNATLTSAEKTLYDVAVSAGTLTLADALKCNSITMSGGGFTSNAKTVYTTDDQTYNGGGALTINANDTCVGDFHIGSGVGAITLGDTLALTGTGLLDIDKASTAFSPVICAYATKTTTITGSAANAYTLKTSTGTLAINTAANITLGAGFTVGRLTIEPASNVILTSGQSYTVSEYTNGDWDGSAGNLVTITATTPGSAATIVNPAGITVRYMSVRDNTATNSIIAYTTLGNVDGGGNALWVFTAPGTTTNNETAIYKRPINNKKPFKRNIYKLTAFKSGD